MKRRDFLKLTCAVPFMGPIMAQMASDPSRLDKLRAISLRIMNAPTVFFNLTIHSVIVSDHRWQILWH